MPLYRKKPVVIEAVQWDGTLDSFTNIHAAFPELQNARFFNHKGSYIEWSIYTLEGSHKVTPGDFIIKGVKGEFYPCKPDIFEATYELVTEPEEETTGE